jgi:hypothetical protein
MASLAMEATYGFDDELPALNVPSKSWQRWLAWGVSFALLVAVLVRLGNFGWTNALATLPNKPAFWLAFATYYFALPGSEWLIFRRLWQIPKMGFFALLRKLVSNEILLGYSGEAYFYAWARQHAKMVASPFGAIKDVSILSALAGNVVTLGMLLVAWPLVTNLAPAIHVQTVITSSSLILGISFLILVFRNRLFSLDRSSLRFVFAVHMARLFATTLLSGILWHLAMPAVPLFWLVILATLQLLVTRLPFIPSKDLLFANLAVFLIGNDATIALVVTMIATAIVMIHLLLGTVLVIPELFKRHKNV